MSEKRSRFLGPWGICAVLLDLQKRDRAEAIAALEAIVARLKK
jgi:hypothetical protein